MRIENPRDDPVKMLKTYMEPTRYFTWYWLETGNVMGNGADHRPDWNTVMSQIQMDTVQRDTDDARIRLVLPT